MKSKIKTIKSLVSPHAGYTYSGSTAAFGYHLLKEKKDLKNVFVIGNSHFVYFEGCRLS